MAYLDPEDDARILHIHLDGEIAGIHWHGRLFIALQYGEVCQPGRTYTAGKAGDIVLRAEELSALGHVLAKAERTCVTVMMGDGKRHYLGAQPFTADPTEPGLGGPGGPSRRVSVDG